MVELERELEHLQAELKRHQQQAMLLRDIALAGRGGSDAQTVFQAIYDRLAEVLPFDAFFVALSDREGAQEYRFVLFMDEGQRFELPNTRIGGLTGYLLEQKRALLFRDLHQEYYQQAIPAPEQFGHYERLSRSWMGVPLLIGREAIGVLSVQSYHAGVYDEADLELLKALGDLAAMAIENAMLYQAQDQLSQSLAERVTARSEELAVLTAIAISFSQGKPIDVLLDEVLERILWLLGMHTGAVLLHERRSLLHRVAYRGDDLASLPAEWVPIDGPTEAAQALRSGQLVETQAAHALLAVPLRAFGQTIGVLTLQGPLRSLTTHEHTLIEAASYQIAVGIENARLLAERERQIAQLEALTSLAVISATTLEPRAMLEHVYTILQPLLQFDGFIAAMYDGERRVLTDGISWHSAHEFQPIDQLPIGNGRLAQLLQQHEPLLIRHTDPLHYQLTPEQPWERDALSWLGVPLLSRGGEPLAVLAIQSQRPDAFDRRDRRFLSAAAHQLALDLENAQLLQATRASAAIAEQRAENLTLVHNISRLVNSSLDPQQVLSIATAELAKLFEVDHCGIVLYSGSGWKGEIVAEYPSLGIVGRNVAFLNVEDFQDDVQIVGQPIYIPSLADDRRVRPIRKMLQRLGIQSMLIIPLISRGRAIGAIGLNSRALQRGYTAEELELCRTIAAQVAIALENARLFQLSVTRLEQEMDIARSIQANLFPSTLPTIPGADLAARCVPARETGGDFYDVLPLGNDRFGLSIGDVSGKSLPAAMVMAVARSIVRSEALDHELPEDVMCQTNTLVAQDVLPDMYVALCYAVYDARHRTLDLALGGQLTPLLHRRDGSVDFVEAHGDLPLGVVAGVRYNTNHIQLERGDTVVFYTDGLVEAFSPTGELFGFERLQHTLAQHGGAPAADLVDQLFAAVQGWQPHDSRHDDVTAVVLRVV